MTENPAILKDKAVQRVADAGVGKSYVYRVISAYMTNHIIGIKSPKNKKDSVCLNKLTTFLNTLYGGKSMNFFKGMNNQQWRK